MVRCSISGASVLKSINSIIKLSNLYDKNGSEVTEFIENFLEIFSLGAVFTRHLLVKSPNYERNPVSRLLSFRPRF